MIARAIKTTAFLCLAAFAAPVLAEGVGAEGRDPVGETAPYQLDRASARTSSLILEGSAVATVVAFDPDAADGPVYDTKLDYDFRVRFAGRQTGSQAMGIPADYFTPEFMAQLRVTRYYATPQFKVQHQGFANARNMDGAVYENCDKLRIYDIQQPAASTFGELASRLLSGYTTSEIEDLEIFALVKEGVPVLGAVKLDIAGKYQGMRVKAGFDYKSR